MKSSQGSRAAARGGFLALTAVLALALPACGGEGETDVGGGETAAAAAGDTSAMGQFRTVQSRLQGIQQEALQDSAIQAQRAQVQAAIEEAMTEVDPETPGNLARMDSLQQQAQDAQSQGDTARMGSLMRTLRRTQVALQRAQMQAMRKQEVSAMVQAFRDSLQSEMVEVDPQAEELMERADSLASSIRASQTGTMGSMVDTASADTSGGG